jgi:hypothetical protein
MTHDRIQERCRRCSPRPAPRPGRGAVLVFVALFVWVAMGIAALVIDQGAARLTQRQLHAAADGVALEAMRERDHARDPLEEDDYFRDRRRRLRANRVAAWHFTNFLVTGLSEDPGTFRGGGAYIDMNAGLGDMDASAELQAAGRGVPRLSPNYSFQDGDATPLNHRWGDVVSGRFHGHQTGPGDDGGGPAGVMGVGGNPIVLEDEKYVRSDFSAAEPEDAPYADSMVVRLRRTHVRAHPSTSDNLDAPGYDRQGNVSTAGDTLPYLFGRGTTMVGMARDSGLYDPRRTGQRIRATSIASSRPAVRVGPPQPQHDSDPSLIDGYNIGTAPFVLHDVLWHFNGEPVWTTEDGGRSYYTHLKHENGFLWNVHFDSLPAGILQPPRMMRVGDRIIQISQAEELWSDAKNWEVAEAYAPVYHRLWAPGQGFRNRVIGFVRVSAEQVFIPNPNGPGLVRAMRVWKLGHDRAEDPRTPWIAPRNASALFDGEQVDLTSLQTEGGSSGFSWDWTDFIRYLNTLERAIHAPVVVR